MTSVSQTILSSVLPPAFPASLSRRAASRLLGFDQADRAYEALRAAGNGPLLENLLQFLEVTFKATPADLNHIPRKGPAVIVANHPFGILEAAVLVTAVRQIRPDVRVLANQILDVLPELRDLVIAVDVFNASRQTNLGGVRRAVKFVRDGGLLIVFPAGAVSHFQWSERVSADPPWNPSVARLIGLTEAPVVPVYVPGSNSFAFHAAGMLHPGLRTALLAHELFNKKRSAVELRIGRPIVFEKLAELPSSGEQIEYLRWRTYLLASRNPFKADTRVLRTFRAAQVEPVVDAVDPAALAQEVALLTPLEQSGTLAVFLAAAGQIPQTLREIGRLREITFRAAGEGTGHSIDLDRFDAHYLHLFVWNTGKQEIVGAYRLQATEATPELYTQTLFRFDQRFLRAMGPAVELGRSFIRAEYQRGFAPLLLLWKGIGKFIAANPRYRILFGPVSISNQYQSVSRDLMIRFLQAREGLADWMDLVSARNAPRPSDAPVHCTDVEELSDVIADLEPRQAGIPVLLRQYLKLGGKLLGFNVDPEFSNALDGLIVVDLTRTGPKLLERYLGKAEATAFLDFQKENPHAPQ